jgi:hypothetical protein
VGWQTRAAAAKHALEVLDVGVDAGLKIADVVLGAVRSDLGHVVVGVRVHRFGGCKLCDVRVPLRAGVLAG